MMYENYGRCYPADTSMADVYYDLQNSSDNETKVFTLESNGSNASFTSNESIASNGSFSRNVAENSDSQNKGFTSGDANARNMSYPKTPVENSSDGQSKVFTVESNGQAVISEGHIFTVETKGSSSSYSKNVTGNNSRQYESTSTSVDSSVSFAKTSDYPSHLNTYDTKYEHYSDFEKTDGTKMLIDSTDMSPTMKGDESVTKMFTSEAEEDDDASKDILPENTCDEFYLNSNVPEPIDVGSIKTENHGKIFTVQSMVTEPSNGLQKNHNGNWLCDICGHEEALKDDILTHRILHLSDDHSKQCPICEKKFSSSTSLRNHLTVHTGIKKFRCKYCGRKFGWKTQLAIHENLHTGKGLHHCHVCTKSFMTKWLLQRHLKIHLKDKRRNDSNSNNQNNWNNNTPNSSASYKYETEISNPTAIATFPAESPPAKVPKCNECNQTFKGEDALAFHLLQHNSAKQNMRGIVNMKNQTSVDDSTDRDVSLENWSSSVNNSDQDKLKMNCNKNPSKGSLTSIVSKLHHKVDEKQKFDYDEATEVLILGSSAENHYSKDGGSNVMKDGLTNEYKLNDSLSKDSSKLPMSSSSDPFISGINETDSRRDMAFMSVNTSTSSSTGKNVESFTRVPLQPNELTNSKQYETVQRELRGYFIKQEKELASLQNMVATLHGKVDSLTNIVTSQSLLINRIFLGGKMVVNGLLDFNVRPSNNGGE